MRVTISCMAPRIVLAALCFAPLPVAAGGPIAEVICAPRDALVQRLTLQYGASLRASGIRDADAVIEVWATEAGRWTLVQRYANGQSCILAMGADWDMALPPA